MSSEVKPNPPSYREAINNLAAAWGMLGCQVESLFRNPITTNKVTIVDLRNMEKRLKEVVERENKYILKVDIKKYFPPIHKRFKL